MPELPEVETVCAGLRQSVVNETVQSVRLNRKDLRTPFPENMDQRLSGRSVQSIVRRAKYILIIFDDNQCLSIHLGMTGQITIFQAAVDYEPRSHDHMVITCDSGALIVMNDARRFGMVHLFDYADIETHKSFMHLGPEPLGNKFSAPILCEALKKKTSAIKVAIMDQRIVVGVGNIYACEALYRSGINPRKQANAISKTKIEELVRNIREVLQEAIEAGGSTLKDYQKTDGSLGYFQHRFSVYDREGEVCAKCTSDGRQKQCIQRIVQSGRSTFYCKVLQT